MSIVNYFIQVQIQQLESKQSSKASSESTPSEFPSRNRRPLSALEPALTSIAIQTDELRNVKSMGDVSRQINLTHSLEQLQEGQIDDVLSEVVSPLRKSQSAIAFDELKLNKDQLNSIQVPMRWY